LEFGIGARGQKSSNDGTTGWSKKTETLRAAHVSDEQSGNGAERAENGVSGSGYHKNGLER